MIKEELNKQVELHLGSALEKFMVGDFNEAIRNLKSAEVLDRGNPQTLYNLGICYARLGLHKTAINYFEKLLSLPFTFVEILKVKKILAFACININNYSRAHQLLDELIAKTPADTTALHMKGYCFQQQKKYFKALKIYKAIIQIEKQNHNTLNSIAYLISLTNGNLDEALAFSLRAWQSDKNNPAYLDTLGYIYWKKGDHEKAQKFLLDAYNKLPFSKEIKEHLALIKRY